MSRALEVARQKRDQAEQEAAYLRGETERLSRQLFTALAEKKATHGKSI